MSRRALAVLAVYGLFAATFATDLYGPLFSGRDDSWAVLLTVVAGHLVLGLALNRAWALLVPVAAALIAALIARPDGAGMFFLGLGAGVAVLVTAVGRAFPRRAGRATIIACALLALVAPVWAGFERVRRGERVPPEVQAALPTEISLGNLCPGAGTPPADERTLRRQMQALVRELRRRPHDLVTYTYYWADAPPEQREITVRELAEEQLRDVATDGLVCAPDVQREIRAAL